ncbi:hypothetical protein TNCV_851921 [Trichonephila clavipes]|nr:hypothetical protein TNCV_851921 [Trichonephila clavipes]
MYYGDSQIVGVYANRVRTLSCLKQLCPVEKPTRTWCKVGLSPQQFCMAGKPTNRDLSPDDPLLKRIPLGSCMIEGSNLKGFQPGVLMALGRRSLLTKRRVEEEEVEANTFGFLLISRCVAYWLSVDNFLS